ncbi:cyclin-like protein [Crepidotus variabilis]|uniref:Cyclin-like protein n=1 Tax=Crepidotus variabilis TaxID=179855 RepID=A0A9P6JSX0_9AGAR|nr:cyclin-like protein [Crepidotus variabilis]
MATDFWASSHYKRWIVDRATLHQARLADLQYVDNPEQLDFLSIYFANLITKLGRKLQFRQRVIATATVFFRRFYLKNSYSETDPFIVIAACCYVAAKAEESPIHIKSIVQESRTVFNQEELNGRPWTTDNQKIAEMEFYLVDDLECDLIIFHPYRTLLALCKRENTPLSTSEEGEDLGIGLDTDDGPRYWGTGEGQLELPTGALQVAWSIINDTYKSQLCLLHPPHLIAIAAIYLSFIIHPPVRPDPSTIIEHESATTTPESHRQPRRSTRQANSHSSSKKFQSHNQQDPIAFLADMNMSLPLLASVSQEIISLYALWDQYKEDMAPDAARLARELSGTSPVASGSISPAKRSMSRADSLTQSYGSQYFGSLTASAGATPVTDTNETLDTASSVQEGVPGVHYVTPAFLSLLVQRMREAKLSDVTPSAQGSSSGSGSINVISGRKMAVNKRLERMQAAG